MLKSNLFKLAYNQWGSCIVLCFYCF